MNFNKKRHPSSYRDPAGFVFEEEGIVYRKINPSYQLHYEKLMGSGLYEELTQKELLITHEQAGHHNESDAYLIIKPKQIDVIVDPHHWTFDMLKDAAMLTLEIQIISLKYGMTLKDAHPMNVQFMGNKPIFIDSLSFEAWEKNEPWKAYRQYCQSFLLPLIVGHYIGSDSPRLLKAWPDGIPLEIGINLLPIQARLKIHWLLHIFLNRRFGKKHRTSKFKSTQISKVNFNNLISSLKIATSQCRPKRKKSEWIDYEEEASSRGEYTASKTKILDKWRAIIGNPQSILDLGSNTGQYTKLFANNETKRIQIESDPEACNKAFLRNKYACDTQTYTLRYDFADLINEVEQRNVIRYISSQVVLCLGLLHHLLYKSNIPLAIVIDTLYKLTKSHLILEFIPHDDEIIDEYFNIDVVELRKCNIEDLEKELARCFNIIRKETIKDSTRQLYLCEKH